MFVGARSMDHPFITSVFVIVVSATSNSDTFVIFERIHFGRFFMEIFTIIKWERFWVIFLKSDFMTTDDVVWLAGFFIHDNSIVFISLNRIHDFTELSIGKLNHFHWFDRSNDLLVFFSDE